MRWDGPSSAPWIGELSARRNSRQVEDSPPQGGGGGGGGGGWGRDQCDLDKLSVRTIDCLHVLSIFFFLY